MFSCLPAPEANKDNRSNFFLETSVIHKRFFSFIWSASSYRDSWLHQKVFMFFSFLTKINVFSYRKTLNINPGLIHGGNYIRRAYKRTTLCLEFFTPTICISRKSNGIRRNKKNALTSKCHFTIWQQTKHVVSFTIRDH